MVHEYEYIILYTTIIVIYSYNILGTNNVLIYIGINYNIYYNNDSHIIYYMSIIYSYMSIILL